MFRIVAVPALFRVPSLAGNQYPFRLGRKPVRIQFRVERKPLQPRAVATIIERRRLVGIRSIVTVPLASRIRIEYRIIEGHSRHRVVERIQRELFASPPFVGHLHGIQHHLEFPPGDLGPFHIKIVGQIDLHRRALPRRSSRIACPQGHTPAIGLYQEHPRKLLRQDDFFRAQNGVRPVPVSRRIAAAQDCHKTTQQKRQNPSIQGQRHNRQTLLEHKQKRI